MPHDAAHIAETNAIAAEMERAGLVTVTRRADGEPIYTVTSKGEKLARQLAMSTEDAGDALVEAPLGE